MVAAEPSGDALGAGLAAALEAREPGQFAFCGVGGPRLAAHGVASPFDISDLAILGLLDGLRIYPLVLRRVNETADLAAELRPDAAVLIDSWGFTIRVAERLRRRRPDLPIIKYVGPQVWAWRAGRAAKLAKAADHVLTLQPFEPPYFEAAGLPATFVGHPALDRVVSGDGEGFRRRYDIAPDQHLIAVLLGSRSAEVRRLAPAIADAITRLQARYGDKVRFVAPLAASVATLARSLCVGDLPSLGEAMFVEETERADAFAAADAAIACSGTVVTELAVAGVPTVVAYKLGHMTWAIARLLVRAPHISLVNLAAEDRVLPELVQFDATGAAIAEEAARFLEDPALAARTRARLADAVNAMRGGGEGASARAADAVLAFLRGREKAAT
ncbi:MAG: lipid-A-disaccharide synthase [Caulobacterales bacterium]|nr:lipid-A-disaccharide synthase [Caulobacterales bacterium]